MPLLLIQSGSDASASTTAGSHAPGSGFVARVSGTATSWKLTSAVEVHTSSSGSGGPQGQATAQTTSTTAAPVPTTVAAPVPTTVPPPTTTVAPPTTTTTTEPPPTTTTRPVVTAAAGTDTSGAVTYYDHAPGTCASPWLPFGTVVRVTNPANGASISCVVDDREADTERSIDLATSTFAEIAPLSQGVIDAQLSW